MSGQEQIKIPKKPPGSCGGEDTGNQDLTAELPDITQVVKAVKKAINKSKNKNCGGDGYCKWSGICTFDCPEKRPNKEKQDGI